MRPRSVFYGWWLSGLAGLVMVASAVPVFHGMAVWSPVLKAQFGWSATQLGAALSLTRAEGALFGPLEGYTADRFGTRVMVTVGLVVSAGAFVLFSQVNNLWIFYLSFMLMSLGQGLGGWVPLMAMLNNWFSRYRGTSMGISMSVMTGGALIVVPVLAWAIEMDSEKLIDDVVPAVATVVLLDSAPLGWRNTALVIAGAILVVAIVAPFLIRTRPDDMGLRPDGDQAEEEPTTRREPTPGEIAASLPPEQELTVKEALKTQAFWCISFGHGFASMIILAIMSQLGLMMTELGYSLLTVGGIVALYNFVALPFQFGGGYIGDRIPTNLALFLFTALQGIAVVLITIDTSLYMFYVFAVLFGIGFGGRTPLTTAIRGEYFGRASFGKILGISTVPMNILLLISAPMAGFMREQLGDYQWAFLTLAILNGIGAVLFLIARKPRIPAAQPAPAVASPAGSGGS